MKFASGVTAALTLTATSFPVTIAALPSFQTGPNNGAVYAAGLVSDDYTGLIYMTGITYDPSFGSNSQGSTTRTSNCFVASMTMDGMSEDAPNDLVTMVYGADDNNADTCRGIAVLSAEQIVVVGNADPGGLYAGGTLAAQVGFGMTLSRDDLTQIQGSSLFDGDQVPYPQAIVVDPSDPDSIFVASMTSQTSTENTVDEAYPNWTHKFKHGTSFLMTVERLQYTTQGTGNTFHGILDGVDPTSAIPTLQRKWIKTYETDADSAPGSSVYVGGMVWKDGVGLIVAGSTSAMGIAYGPAEGDDEDGFISILDPSSGELVQGRKNNQRFGTGEFDIVMSVCDSWNEPNAFYIVGATKGDMDGIRDNDQPVVAGSLQAFIKKVNLDSLHGFWTVQHGAQLNMEVTETTAVGCVAYDDVVYVAGVVSGGAGMIDGQKVKRSSGGDDIWVAQYAATDGNVNWIKQIGSEGNENVARQGGITIDEDGNAIVYGDTTGSLFRERAVSDESDLFGIMLDYGTGYYATTIGGDAPDDPDNELVDYENTDDEYGEDDDEYYTAAPEIGKTDPENLPSEAAVNKFAKMHQSGPNSGAIYAGGIAYDAASDQAIIVGVTYTDTSGKLIDQPSCLIARIEIESMETKAYNILGTDGILEACRGVAITPANNILSSTVVVVGNSEDGGLFNDDDDLQIGFGMSLSGDDLSLQQGASLFSAAIPYPEAVITDGSVIYVASMNSNDRTENIQEVGSSGFPNWTYRNKYGKGFTMAVEKLNLADYSSIWSQNYPIQAESDGTLNSVFVGGLILKSDRLIAVGSTRAKGEAYGPAEGDDTDGFITILDPNTGQLLSGVKNNARIGSAADDVVSEICDIPQDPSSFIIIGATKGDVGGIRGGAGVPEGSLQWFAKKINMEYLNEEWTIQGGAIFPNTNLPTSAFAVGCAVRDNVVYVGGTVENGAQLFDGSGTPQQSMGGNDVFVAQLDLNDGSINWVSQIGSVGDDQLARNSAITTDKNGDVLIYGDTTGPFYRERNVNSNSDIFLAVLQAADGDFAVKGTAAPGSGPATNLDKYVPTAAPVAPQTLDEAFDKQGDVIPDDIVALQLGPDVGPSYAGGMAYDRRTNSIYLTGATYGAFGGWQVRPSTASSCFFARIDLPELELIQRESYGVDNYPDACTAISPNYFNQERNAIMIGSTEAGGILTDLSANENRQNGIAIDLSFSDKFNLVGGSVVGDEFPVTFPVDLVVDGDSFWVVSMTSYESKVNADFNKVKHNKFPDLTNGGVLKYGKDYKMSIESFKVTRSGDGNPFAQGAAQTFQSQFVQQVGLDSEHDGIAVAAMIPVGDVLVVVGSVNDNGNMDGFMAKINRNDGTLELGTGNAVGYYKADKRSDDWLMSACADPNDPNFFYVVGASSGKIEDKKKPKHEAVHAIVSKVAVQDLRAIWEKRFEVTHSNASRKGKYAASAYGCDVVATENILYVGGVVEDGAILADALTGRSPAVSAGGDDIFVASLSTLDGQLSWLKQVGSNGDDHMARSGGIKADANGNAVLFGDTDGDFFRDRFSDQTKDRFPDPFIMMFDKHYGIHQSPFVGPKISGSSIPTEFFNSFTEGKTGAQIFGYIVLALVLLFVVYYLYKKGYCNNCRRKTKQPSSMYDASPADTEFEDQPTVSLTKSARGLGLFRDNPKDDSLGGPNLNYRDDADDNGDLVGNFHKTYSDLPQNGKEII